MKIERIYIACFKHDVRFARILVASIRFWYPDIPILLIKDESYGPFDTSSMEEHWGVGVMPTTRKTFGWGFGKLEPLFAPEKHRFLILDSDIVMVGPVLSVLEQYDDDFIVMYEDPPDADFIQRLYFDLEALNELDPCYKYPGFTFNTGQIVATSGILKRNDFDEYVNWGRVPSLRHPDIFRCGEQGLLNYILTRKQAKNEISLRRVRFMEVADQAACQNIKLAELAKDSPYRFVIHWCGLLRPASSPGLAEMHRSDLLLHFENLYYSGMPLGKIHKFLNVYGYAAEMAMRKHVGKIPGVRKLRELIRWQR
jgi:hypothetical protein